MNDGKQTYIVLRKIPVDRPRLFGIAAQIVSIKFEALKTAFGLDEEAIEEGLRKLPEWSEIAQAYSTKEA
jgi:hypothetical protein